MTMKGSVLWDVTPCSLVKVNWHFRGTLLISSGLKSKTKQGTSVKQAESRASFIQVSFLAFFSMEVMCFFETSDFHQSARRYIPVHRTLDSHVIICIATNWTSPTADPASSCCFISMFTDITSYHVTANYIVPSHIIEWDISVTHSVLEVFVNS
jgi:hypothetical protein